MVGSNFFNKEAVMKRHPEIRSISLDGKLTPNVRCPKCGVWASIDDDQFYGRVSIDCMTPDCTYQETHNFNTEAE